MHPEQAAALRWAVRRLAGRPAWLIRRSTARFAPERLDHI